MSLGTLGWGHRGLAKKLGGEARKGGCGQAEIRQGPERKSYSGAGLVSGLGKGLGPETQEVYRSTDQGRGQETECRRKKLKGIRLKGLCRDGKETAELAPRGVLQPPELEWDPRGLCADPTAVCKYLSELFFKTRCKTMLSASFMSENLAELDTFG